MLPYQETPLDFVPEMMDDLIEFQGKRFRWFRAFSAMDYAPSHGVYSLASALATEDGSVYDEQEPPAGEPFKALIRGLDKRVMGPDGALIPVGQGTIAFKRETTPLTDSDKLILLDWEFAHSSKCKKGEDRLFHVPATELVAVRSASQSFVIGTDCELHDNQTQVRWLDGGNAPAANEYYTAIYRYNPTYYFLENQFRPARRNQEGELLFEAGILTLRLNRDDGV